MIIEDKNRRDFLKIGGAALATTVVPWTANSYAAIVGANDRVRLALIGAGDRAKSPLVPAFQDHAKELNFEFVAVSDIWNRRRDEGAAYIQKKCGSPIASVRNNDELYARKDVDAVIIAAKFPKCNSLECILCRLPISLPLFSSTVVLFSS